MASAAKRRTQYALRSQQRTAAAQAEGRFADEIVPVTATMGVKDKETGEVSMREVTLDKDEGNRPDTTIEGLSALQPVLGPDTHITAGNASQLSDGSSACIVMDAAVAEKKGLQPLGRYIGMAVAGTEPDEMGIGPVFAVPKLLKRFGLKIDDIGLWELNEAFAVQVLYCQDKLGIPDDIFNVNGGAISIGHPYGMSGRAAGRPRADRRQAPRRQTCRRDDVRRRRHGRGRAVRGAVSEMGVIMSAIETVEQLYGAFAAGDGASLARLLAETHWIEARGGPYGGIYKGFGEIAENVFGPIGRDVRDFTAIPDELLSIANDRVLALGRYRGASDAGPLGYALWASLDRAGQPHQSIRTIRRYPFGFACR